MPNLHLIFLNNLTIIDPMMFYRNMVDAKKRLEHLFWCDGIMQDGYKLFGDMLAFDATYGKNKYQCWMVVLV